MPLPSAIQPEARVETRTRNTGDAGDAVSRSRSNNYLSSLKKLGAEIWIGGARAGDVTVHPTFANCARSVASLYDMQMSIPKR